MPQAANQSARASRSAVQAPNFRTCGGRLGGWSAGGGGRASGGTAAQCCAAWTSIPAACGFCTRNGSADWGRRRKVFVRRGVIAASRKEKGERRRPQAREGVECEQSPKRGHRPNGSGEPSGRAANGVSATSRGHAKQRARSAPTYGRPPRPAAGGVVF